MPTEADPRELAIRDLRYQLRMAVDYLTRRRHDRPEVGENVLAEFVTSCEALLARTNLPQLHTLFWRRYSLLEDLYLACRMAHDFYDSTGQHDEFFETNVRQILLELKAADDDAPASQMPLSWQ